MRNVFTTRVGCGSWLFDKRERKGAHVPDFLMGDATCEEDEKKRKKEEMENIKNNGEARGDELAPKPATRTRVYYRYCVSLLCQPILS